LAVAPIAASYALAVEQRYANPSAAALFDIGPVGVIALALLCFFFLGYYNTLAYWFIAAGC
jgi:hypothetical protein